MGAAFLAAVSDDDDDEAAFDLGAPFVFSKVFFSAFLAVVVLLAVFDFSPDFSLAAAGALVELVDGAAAAAIDNVHDRLAPHRGVEGGPIAAKIRQLDTVPTKNSCHYDHYILRDKMPRREGFANCVLSDSI